MKNQTFEMTPITGVIKVGMKIEYEIVQRNDKKYVICEIRYMDHSVNTRQIYVDDTKKKMHTKTYRNKEGWLK